MSAPEPQVRVLFRPGESLTPGYPWARECEGCDERIGYWATLEDCQRDAMEHENTCAATQLARLQARWDARGKALRALIEQWRSAMDELDSSARTAVRLLADELERAMEEVTDDEFGL